MAKYLLALSGIALGGLLGFFGSFSILALLIAQFLAKYGIHPLFTLLILSWVFPLIGLIGAALLGLLGYQLGKHFYNDSDQVGQSIEEADVS